MILTFDIGGSFIKAACVSGEAPVIPIGTTPTPTTAFDRFAAALRSFLPADGTRFGGVAVSIAGVVDPADGRVHCANIPCIDGRALARDLTALFECDVTIGNDGDCFALAEARLGAGAGHASVFGIILGTGVGGGLVIGDALIRGMQGLTGEWGHGPMVPAGQPGAFRCGCGQLGCLDAVGGARGIERLHQALHAEALSSFEIIGRWQAGDAAAAATVEMHVDLISTGLSIVVNTVGVSIVPVGGGLGSVVPLVEAIDLATRRKILHAHHRRLVVPGICRPNPGMIGAALLAGHAPSPGLLLAG